MRFRYLQGAPPIDWRGFGGEKILLEHDAIQNYSTISGDRLMGAWPPEFERHGFDRMIVTGSEIATRLEDEGICATWVPKGYDPETFFDEDGRRVGVCHYGKRYPARYAMLRHVRRAGIRIDHVAAPFEEMNAVLNRHAACVVCNMDGVPAFEPLHRVIPGVRVRVRPGIEVMIKNFEVAGSGCGPFFDAIPELADLGFVDGETAFIYRDFDELVERLRSASPEELRAVGRRAAELARTRHTWSHRVEQILQVV